MTSACGGSPFSAVKSIENADLSSEFRKEIQCSIKERKAKGRSSDHIVEAFGGEAFWRQSAGIFLFYSYYPPPSVKWVMLAADFLSSKQFKRALLKREGIHGAEVVDLHWAWGRFIKNKKVNDARRFAREFFLPYSSWVENAVKNCHGLLPCGRTSSRGTNLVVPQSC